MTTQEDNKLFDELADLAECFDVLNTLLVDEVTSGRGLFSLSMASVIHNNLNGQLKRFLDTCDSRGLLS